MTQHPNMHVCLLDLKQAYDTVDRSLLWRDLRDKYDFQPWLIDILKVLFDNNCSILTIQGQHSREIRNNRGLLQGSVLSPILFNFYINSLLEQLGHHEGITIHGIHRNHLAYADDIILMSKSMDNLQRLIKTCEIWSRQYQMTFNVQKCEHLSAGSDLVAMLGQPIPRKRKVKYLGMTFKASDKGMGLDWKTSLLERSKKAKVVTEILGDAGMNLGGFSVEASLRLYKCFIEPALTYGLQIAPLPREYIEILEKAAAAALRRIFSASRNTSRNAMLKLGQIRTAHQANLILNARFAANLHNNSNAGPAGKIWRN
jgi:hypothetical protein